MRKARQERRARDPEPRFMDAPKELVDVEALLAGNRAALARAITLIESKRPDHRAQARDLLDRVMPKTGGAIRVGITGVPGVGKSTAIDSLGSRLIAQGHRVAVLAVDPSSSRTGGAILGDKTPKARAALNEQAVVRPSPSSGTPAGGAADTRGAGEAVVEGG